MVLTPRSRSCLTPQTSCRFDGLNSEVRYTYDVTAAIEIVRLAENSYSLIRAPLHQVNTPFCLIVRPTQTGRAGELHGHQWFGCVQRTPLGRAEPCGADVRDGASLNATTATATATMRTLVSLAFGESSSAAANPSMSAAVGTRRVEVTLYLP